MARKSRKRPKRGPAQKNIPEKRSGFTSTLLNIGRNKVIRALALVAAGFAVGYGVGKQDNQPLDNPPGLSSPTPPPIPDPNQRLNFKDGAKGREYEFKPIPGVLKTLPPTKTCDVDTEAFKGDSLFGKYGSVIKNCRGKLQGGNNTFLKTTIADYHADSSLFHRLDLIVNSTGLTYGLRQPNRRTFVFHRKDGKDGLPGGNLTTFSPQAMTSMQPGGNPPDTFSSIPLGGDKDGDVGALATEVCQTRLFFDIRSEMFCNGFGLAAKSAYQGFSYQEYIDFANSVEFLLPAELSQRKLQFQLIRKEVYQALVSVLGSQPDILQKN